MIKEADPMISEEMNGINEKIRVLEQRKKALEYKLTNEGRKERTRRLIQKGALLEKYLNIEELTVEETEIVLKVVANFKNKNTDYFENQIRRFHE